MILLLVGGLLAGIGWLVGVVLLWTSRRWTIGDKVLGTLVWPGGVAAALAAPAVLFLRQVNTGPHCATVTAGQLCPTSAPTLDLPGWLFVLALVVLALLAVGGPAWMAARLMRRAREARPASRPRRTIACPWSRAPNAPVAPPAPTGGTGWSRRTRPTAGERAREPPRSAARPAPAPRCSR